MVHISSMTDEQLVKSYANGNNEAFDALIADGTMEALGAKYEVNICK